MGLELHQPTMITLWKNVGRSKIYRNLRNTTYFSYLEEILFSYDFLFLYQSEILLLGSNILYLLVSTIYSTPTSQKNLNEDNDLVDISLSMCKIYGLTIVETLGSHFIGDIIDSNYRIITLFWMW